MLSDWILSSLRTAHVDDPNLTSTIIKLYENGKCL